MRIIKGIKPEYVDQRGAITKLLDDGHTKIRSILLITSKKGSVRSNHYHKRDAHFIYILSGKMEYREKGTRKGSRLQRAILGAGDMVYTPPQAIHTTKFLSDSVFLALSIRSRHQKSYEKDLVRTDPV